MRKKKSNITLPNNTEVDKFERMSPLLNSIFREMKEFAKKKPDDPINVLKVRMINKILSQVKEFLKTDPNVEFLELLDEETLPTNSDTVIIIGQFRAILDQFQTRYFFRDDQYSDQRWHSQEEP